MNWTTDFSPITLNKEQKLDDLYICYLPCWKAIIATGDDKKSYLQGQLTCDLTTVNSNSSTLGAHCDAKGAVWGIFRLFHHQDGYAMLQHASAIDDELEQLKKYSVFSKVDLSISSDIALGLTGDKAGQLIDQLSSESGDVRSIKGGSAVKIDNQRWLLLVDTSTAQSIVEQNPQATLSDQLLWDKYDIDAALPRIIDGIQAKHIPQAFNLQSLEGISFNKGCYTGQETVARSKYRGTNKRAMYKVDGLLPNEVTYPVKLERQVGESWRHAGELLAHYQYSDGSAIGLIILPNDLADNTLLRVTEHPSLIWQLSEQPYSLSE